MRNVQIENAKIASTKLEMVNGMLVGWLHLKFKDGGVGFGGRVLAKPNDVSNGYGSQWIYDVIDTVGVNSWEELIGSYIRVKHTGWGGSVKEIGHIVEDKWFSQEELEKLCQ